MNAQRQLDAASSWNARILQLLREADKLAEQDEFARAIELCLQAWRLLPNPLQHWGLAGWISVSLFHNYFELGQFDEARRWATFTVEYQTGQTTAAELMNIGMAQFELKNFVDAYEHFQQAYALGKYGAFDNYPARYLNFYLSNTGVAVD